MGKTYISLGTILIQSGKKSYAKLRIFPQIFARLADWQVYAHWQHYNREFSNRQEFFCTSLNTYFRNLLPCSLTTSATSVSP